MGRKFGFGVQEVEGRDDGLIRVLSGFEQIRLVGIRGYRVSDIYTREQGDLRHIWTYPTTLRLYEIIGILHSLEMAKIGRHETRSSKSHSVGDDECS